MKIKVDTVKLALEVLIEKLKDDGIEEIELSHDYYWDVSDEECYEIYTTPEQEVIGQLNDDLLELEQIVSGEREANGTSAKRIAAILRYIAYKVPY